MFSKSTTTSPCSRPSSSCADSCRAVERVEYDCEHVLQNAQQVRCRSVAGPPYRSRHTPQYPSRSKGLSAPVGPCRWGRPHALGVLAVIWSSPVARVTAQRNKGAAHQRMVPAIALPLSQVDAKAIVILKQDFWRPCDVQQKATPASTAALNRCVSLSDGPVEGREALFARKSQFSTVGDEQLQFLMPSAAQKTLESNWSYTAFVSVEFCWRCRASTITNTSCNDVGHVLFLRPSHVNKQREWTRWPHGAACTCSRVRPCTGLAQGINSIFSAGGLLIP